MVGSPTGTGRRRSVGHPSAKSISYSVASAMLDYTKQRIGQLVADDLLQHAEGGVQSPRYEKCSEQSIRNTCPPAPPNAGTAVTRRSEH